MQQKRRIELGGCMLDYRLSDLCPGGHLFSLRGAKPAVRLGQEKRVRERYVE
jgi:hypothetical protein